MKRRGQAFSSEFLLAYFVFMIVLSMALYAWTLSTKKIIENERLLDMESQAIDASEQLIRTPGYPLDWNKTSVESIGLASESRVLDWTRVSYFIDLMTTSTDDLCTISDSSNYECNRYLLGLGVYDFHFNLLYTNGTSIASTGKEPVNETHRIGVERTAILNNSIVNTVLTVWSVN